MRPRPYSGATKRSDFTRTVARNAVIASLEELFDRDDVLMVLDLAEEPIVHHFARYLQNQFPDLHVDVDYNGVEQSHPKTIYQFRDRGIHEVWPDVIVHWRTYRTNLLVIEVKRTTNTSRRERDNDDYKLISFTSPTLPDGPQYAYKFGLFLDIAAGIDVHQTKTLYAYGTWYEKGKRRKTVKLHEAPVHHSWYE
jgi:hypothetical protein